MGQKHEILMLSFLHLAQLVLRRGNPELGGLGGGQSLDSLWWWERSSEHAQKPWPLPPLNYCTALEKSKQLLIRTRHETGSLQACLHYPDTRWSASIWESTVSLHTVIVFVWYHNLRLTFLNMSFLLMMSFLPQAALGSLERPPQQLS